MTRVDDYLNLVDDPDRQAIQPGDAADDALLALLVHVAFSDGEVHAEELAFLQRALPGREPNDLLAWVKDLCQQPLDYEAVAEALPTVEERWKGLRFAARMAWKDGELDPEERELLLELRKALRLPPDAVDRVLREMRGRVAPTVAGERILEAVNVVPWDSVSAATGPCEGPLKGVAPGGLHPVARITLDADEAVALYETGLAADFLGGPGFVPWRDIVAYTRVPTFGASVQLHLEDGGVRTLVDHRLRGLATLLDRLFQSESESEAERPPRPEIIAIRRGDD